MSTPGTQPPVVQGTAVQVEERTRSAPLHYFYVPGSGIYALVGLMAARMGPSGPRSSSA